jgi:hypothetical protein
MFIENKYTKWYFSIVNRAKSRVFDDNQYIEKHHIIPRSLGGNNDLENLVSLTAKEHFICHLLLTKMTSGSSKTKMVYAAWRMGMQCNKNQKRYKISSIIYSQIKKQRSDYMKTLVGLLNPNFGKKTNRTSDDFTPEWRAKISASRKGKSSWNKGIPRTDAVKEAVSKANKGRKTPGFTGRKHSEETKKKIAETFARKKLLLAC